MDENIPENNHNLSNDTKISLSPVSQDMVNLSNQRAEEFAKPFELEQNESPSPNDQTNQNEPAENLQNLSTNTDLTSDINLQQLNEATISTPEQSYSAPAFPAPKAPIQQETVVAIQDDSPAIKRKEKWSIALGFSTIPICLMSWVLAIYVAFQAFSLSYGSSLEAVSIIIKIVRWICFAAMIAMPIVGFNLGKAYEKATGKISVGKILSIVSGIFIAMTLALQLIQNINQEIQKSNIKNDSSTYRIR